MTTTAEPTQAIPAVDDRLTAREQYAALPIGSRIRGNHRYTKTTEDEWLREGTQRTFTNSYFSTGGDIRVDYVPGVDEPSPALSIGQRVTPSVLPNLPVGTYITGNFQWVRRAANVWERLDNSSRVSDSHFSLGGSTRGMLVYHLPGDTETVTTTIAIGNGLNSQEDFAELPIGAVLGPAGDHSDRFVKIGAGQFVHHSRSGVQSSGSTEHAGLALGGYNRLIALPPHVEVKEKVETFDQFRWRFRDVALRASIGNGISMDPVHKVLQSLGCDRDSLPPMMKGMAISNGIDLQEMPEGSVVHVGSPENWNNFAMFGKAGRRWMLLAGGMNLTSPEGYTVNVASGEGVVSVEEPVEMTDEERQAIANFKARAYRIGLKAKRANSWCGEYERAMSQLEINESCLRVGGFVIGEDVTAEQASQLPEGTFLSWSDSAGNWAYYVRDNTRTNQARTRRIAGHWPHVPGGVGHYRPRMTIVGFPEPGDITTAPVPDGVSSLDLLRGLTSGTRIDYSGTLYRVCQENTVGTEGAPIDRRGPYEHTSFPPARISVVVSDLVAAP